MCRQPPGVLVHVVVAAVAVGVGIDRAGAQFVHFFTILERVPIRVPVQGIRSVGDLIAVRKAVPIGVGDERVCT